MKAFYMMFVVFAVLGFAAPMASAQDGWPGCPWGSAYDPTEHGFIAECFWQPAANAAASKAAGLAAPAPAEIPEQRLSCLLSGDTYDPILMLKYGPECMSRSADNAATPKSAGLAAPAPAVIPEQRLSCLLSGDTYDPILMLKYGPECLSQSDDSTATPKTAGLAAPIPAVIPEQRLSCLSWHDAYDPMTHALVLECLSWSTDKAAAKPAGLAAPAPPAQMQIGPCGSGEILDPLTFACLR